MADVIVVFPNKDNAINIRNILTRGGCEVIGVCTTGAQVLHYTELLDEGIVVCGYKLADMLYTELREYLPKEFEMLLVASPEKWQGDNMEGVVGLNMPIKVYDLLNTMKLIKDAKELLMARNNMTEEEAHRYLQKCSMDSGNNIVETAEMVLSIMSE